MTIESGEAELHFWDNYWHLICHRSEVSSARDFLLLNVNGEEVAVFNDGASVIAFDNLCPHRGARIFTESFGNAPFLCPYHGWSYSKGRLFFGRRDQFKACAGTEPWLPTYKSSWVGEFLFISKAAEHSVEEQLGETYEIIKDISDNIDYRYDFNSYEYECSWQIAVENALEPYHVSSIHPKSLGTLQLGDGENTYYGENSIWRTSVGDTRMEKTLNKFSNMMDLKSRHDGYMNIYVFPFSMISSTFGMSYSIQHFLPSRERRKAHFISRLFPSRLKPDAKTGLFEDFFSSTAQMNRQVFSEDAAICSRVPVSSWSPQAPSFYADSEERLVHFRRTYRHSMERAGLAD
jgi:phenylpropionate dioxygenase-like ring-hydroxylating dioxygenase large terminal subunit